MSTAPTPLSIAQLLCENPFVLAPMCDVSTPAFRSLCRELGAGLTYTELLSSSELAQTRGRTMDRLRPLKDDDRVVVQISTERDEGLVAEAARQVTEHGAKAVDLNCGCPVPKVVSGGGGSAVLRNLGLLRRILKAVREAISVPLTIKIRSGWNEESINALEVGQIAVEEGADAIALHARTRAQGYRGRADWSLIGALAAALPIPVIGNGDVFEADDGRRMLDQTGCAGVMVGRGAMGNPWIFRGLASPVGVTSPHTERPTPAELCSTIRRHFEGEIQGSLELPACLRFRKQLLWYTHGLPVKDQLRKALGRLTDRAAYLEVIGELGQALADAGFAADAPLPGAGLGRASFAPSTGQRR